MRTVRSALVFSWMVISVIPVGGLIVLGSLFLNSDRLYYWFAQPWLRGAIGAARMISGVQYRVQGLEHLPEAGAGHRVILCPKHQSAWETFFFPSIMPRPLAYVFKRELLWIPFFGWALGRIDMVHIDRSARSEAWNKVAVQGARLMDDDKWVIMFPEGTRTERGQGGPYKTGATRLALATGAMVIPIAVTSGRCWPRKTFSFRPGVVDVSIGPALIAEPEESAGALMRRVEEWIEREMRRLDPEAYPAHERLDQEQLAAQREQDSLAQAVDAARGALGSNYSDTEA